MDEKSGIAPELVPALPRADGEGIRGNDGKISPNLGDGSFVYRLPLVVPIGRAGVQPSLELTYRLRAHGNGAFGAGWNIDTLAIRRRTDRGFPRYDSNDEFVLDTGERLVHVGGGEYRPLVEEQFRRIRHDGTQWEITAVDGTRTLLGATAESRLHDPSRPERVFEWRVSSVEDLNSNVIRYRYDRDVRVQRPEGYAAAQLYLRKIEYTTLANGDHLAAVMFVYDDTRPDAWTDFRAGFPIRTSRRCIESWSFVGDLQAGVARNVNFATGQFDGIAAIDLRETSVAASGALVSRPATGTILIEFPIPLSNANLRIQTMAGGSYHVRQTAASGVVAEREVVSGADGALDVGLDALVVRVEVSNLTTPAWGVSRIDMPADRIPVVHARYRFEYGQTVVDVAEPDAENVLPATLHLHSVRRSGFDDGGVEASLPATEFRYKALNLEDLVPMIVSGTPAEPLGSGKTTLLSFAGSGRPDLFQTKPFHRVFFNRGRVNPEVVVEGRQLIESPSVGLDELDVFLRDVRGLGAVDLTTPEYYYPNPSADGSVSRTAPGWGARRGFDDALPHPALSPEQLTLSRSIDLDCDGRPDLLCTDQRFIQWSNLGDGAWSASRQTERVSSFGEARFPDVSFDDPHVFIADMNGDGLDEIVRVSGRKVEYWTTVSGEWRYLKSTMANAPRIRDFEPRRLVLADVTGNGAADFLYVHGNSIEIFVNVGGSRFSEGIVVDFTDYALTHGLPMPNTAGFAAAVDMLGEGVPGLLWSMPRTDVEPNYFFLPLSRLGKPFVLTSVRNGIGGEMALEYSTSAVLAAEDENLGRPWSIQPPYPVVVVTRVQERDLMDTSAVHTVEYRYRDGWYDRNERAFRGFAEVEERRLEIPGVMQGLLARHRFENGRTASAAPSDIAAARALAGRKTRTGYHRMADGALLREEYTIHRADPVQRWAEGGSGSRVATGTLVGPRPDEIVTAPYVFHELRIDAEGTSAPRYSGTEYSRRVTTASGEVVDEAGRLRSETRYGELAPGGGPNVIATVPAPSGAITLVSAGDPTARRTEYRYAENAAAHLWDKLAQVIVWSGAAFDVIEDEHRLYYDDGSAVNAHLALGDITQGNLQRVERLYAKTAPLRAEFGDAVINALGADAGAAPGYFLRTNCEDGDAGLFSIVERHVYARAAGRIQFGVRLQTVDARGATTTYGYDAELWQLRSVTNALAHVRTIERTDYRTGAPVRSRDENGVITANVFDAFGRTTSIRRDTAHEAAPQVHFDYFSSAFEADGSPTGIRIRQLIDASEVPLRYVTRIRYHDGFGREMRVATSSDSHGGDFVTVGKEYRAGGNVPTRVSVPFWSADPKSADASGEPARTIARDPLERDVRVVEPDGAARTVSYGVRTAAFADAEDLLAGGDHEGTAVAVTYDAFGRTAGTRQIVRHATGVGVESTVTVGYAYDVMGRLIRVTRPDGQTIDYEYAALGQLLSTTHPDFGTMSRLTDAAGAEVYTINAAGVARWFEYDALGRLASEIAGTDRTAAAAVTYSYDDPAVNGVGRLTRVVNVEEQHTTQYQFDRFGNTTGTTITVAGTGLGAETATYNALRLPRQRTFADGGTIDYRYGSDGRPNRADFTSGVNAAVARLFDAVRYDKSGAVASAALLGGAVGLTATFSPVTQRLTRRQYVRAADNGSLLDLAISTYDRVGNIRAFSEAVNGGAALDWALAYDSLYRLRTATSTPTGGGAVVADFTYHHDGIGNMLRNDEAAPGRVLQYDAANGPDLVRGTDAAANTFAYDTAGRATRTPELNQITWTDNGRARTLRTAAGDVAAFLYTHKGRVLRVTTTPAGGGAARAMTLVSSDHEVDSGNDRYYGLLGGERVVEVAADGQMTLPLRSLAGNVVGVTDGTGAVNAASVEQFAPFGGTVGGAPAAPHPRGYGGAIRTLGSISAMGARGVFRRWGRFLSPDPLAMSPSTPLASPDAREINPYAFALSNPPLYVDRSGLQAKKDPETTPQTPTPTPLAGTEVKDGTTRAWARVEQKTPYADVKAGVSVEENISGSVFGPVAAVKAEAVLGSATLHVPLGAAILDASWDALSAKLEGAIGRVQELENGSHTYTIGVDAAATLLSGSLGSRSDYVGGQVGAAFGAGITAIAVVKGDSKGLDAVDVTLGGLFGLKVDISFSIGLRWANDTPAVTSDTSPRSIHRGSF